jgi:hypothetical protein
MKLEKYLSEAKVKEFPLDVLKKIEKMTDRNDHNGARILTAKTIKNKKMLDAYEGTKKVAQFFGHMPQGLLDTRYQIDQMMWNYVKNNYSNGQDVYMAF